jgi:hypothetical protein
VDIYNPLGRKVAQLHQGIVSAGRHEFFWNADGFSSGVYLIKASNDAGTATVKAVLLK